jgi:hypothetical protein
MKLTLPSVEGYPRFFMPSLTIGPSPIARHQGVSPQETIAITIRIRNESASDVATIEALTVAAFFVGKSAGIRTLPLAFLESFL